MSKRILFVYLEEGKESLAIEYLSSALKSRGHLTDLIIEYGGERRFKDRLFKRIIKFKPNFVAFSVVSDNYVWACEKAKLIKENFDVRIMFGGIHVTSCPEEVIKNDFVDYAVLGEGDYTIVELVENPEKTKIKNVWLKHGGRIIKNPLRDLIVNLDKLPFPNKELFYREAPHLKKKYYCIIGKGCPFSCTYCFNNYMKKLYRGQKWVRKRSVNSVIKELKVMKREIGYKRVYFADDCLTDNKGWLKEFAKKYKEEINVPFTGQSHAQFLDKEVCNILKEMGCIKMQVGAQTPIEEKRTKICKRFDTNESIQMAVDNLKKNKIIVQVDHIFKLPTETVEEYQEGLNFYIDLKPDNFVCFVLQYYPNIEITNIGLKTGDLTKKLIKKIEMGQVSSITSLKNKENKDLLMINRLIHWIPILPRKISKIIVKKKLYPLFFSDYLNKIPFLLQYATSLTLIKGFPLSLYRILTLRKIRRRLS